MHCVYLRCEHARFCVDVFLIFLCAIYIYNTVNTIYNTISISIYIYIYSFIHSKIAVFTSSRSGPPWVVHNNVSAHSNCDSFIHVDFVSLLVCYSYVAPMFFFEWNKEVLQLLTMSARFQDGSFTSELLKCPQDSNMGRSQVN